MYDLNDVHEWALAQVAAKGENYIYREEARLGDDLGAVDCFYYENGEPSCIIGRMLDAKGLITEAELYQRRLDGAWAGAMIYGYGLSGEFTDSAVGFMVRLQRLQDGGTPWGEAVETALQETKRDYR